MIVKFFSSVLFLIFFSSFCSHKKQDHIIIGTWELIDDMDCPDFICFKDNGSYYITNDCGVDYLEKIYTEEEALEATIVERGNWKLKKDRLVFSERKIVRFYDFHEYHGVKKELEMRVNFKSRDTLQLFFKRKNGKFNPKIFETYVRYTDDKYKFRLKELMD